MNFPASNKEKIEEFLNTQAKGESASELLPRLIATLRNSKQFDNFKENPQFMGYFEKHGRYQLLTKICSGLSTIAPSAHAMLEHSVKTTSRPRS